MNSKYAGVLLVIWGLVLAGPVRAQEDCARLRPHQIGKASDVCVSAWQARLQDELDRRYGQMVSQLPATGSPASDDEFEGIDKESAQRTYADWKKHAESFCTLAAGRYGLTRKYESRERSVCWIREAWHHLDAIKGF